MREKKCQRHQIGGYWDKQARQDHAKASHGNEENQNDDWDADHYANKVAWELKRVPVPAVWLEILSSFRFYCSVTKATERLAQLDHGRHQQWYLYIPLLPCFFCCLFPSFLQTVLKSRSTLFRQLRLLGRFPFNEVLKRSRSNRFGRVICSEDKGCNAGHGTSQLTTAIGEGNMADALRSRSRLLSWAMHPSANNTCCIDRRSERKPRSDLENDVADMDTTTTVAVDATPPVCRLQRLCRRNAIMRMCSSKDIDAQYRPVSVSYRLRSTVAALHLTQVPTSVLFHVGMKSGGLSYLTCSRF